LREEYISFSAGWSTHATAGSKHATDFQLELPDGNLLDFLMVRRPLGFLVLRLQEASEAADRT